MQHFQKLISTFNKNQTKKPITTSLLVITTVSMAKPTIKPETQANKQKRGQLAKANSAKHAKKTKSLNFYLIFGSIFSRSK